MIEVKRKDCPTNKASGWYDGSEIMPPKKHPGAVALGRLGGKARAKALSKEKRSELARKAGKARLKTISAEERSAIARGAVQARWAKKK